MPYLPAVFSSPLKGRVLERLLRRGPATLTGLSRDLEASRQQVAAVVAELRLLGVVDEAPGETDRRTRLVRVNEGHPFVEPLRVLAVDGAAFFEAPETWQRLLSRRFGEAWYVGGYAAMRRVMQPIDFEDDHVLVNLVGPDEVDVPAVLERAAGIRLRTRRVDHVPPQVVPVERDGAVVWFATPERGFVEAWRLKEVPLYGLFLCLVQGLHEGALDARKLLDVAPGERMGPEVRTLLAAVRERVPLRGLEGDDVVQAARALTREEREALDHAFNTVVG